MKEKWRKVTITEFLLFSFKNGRQIRNDRADKCGPSFWRACVLIKTRLLKNCADFKLIATFRKWGGKTVLMFMCIFKFNQMQATSSGIKSILRTVDAI